MDEVVREGLASREQFEQFDGEEAEHVFHRLNESWEEMYAVVGPDSDVFIPRAFLDGRKAYLFHMFYRVVELHDQEVKRIEVEGKVG